MAIYQIVEGHFSANFMEAQQERQQITKVIIHHKGSMIMCLKCL